jgi:hypothetical protein
MSGLDPSPGHQDSKCSQSCSCLSQGHLPHTLGALGAGGRPQPQFPPDVQLGLSVLSNSVPQTTVNWLGRAFTTEYEGQHILLPLIYSVSL